MNVIDLEILIPASPEFIWRFLGDLSKIPDWQEDVMSVSFLSTQREGRGARWRQSPSRGKDIVVELSAWYDTLGYEYLLVDGTSFAENQGRIRLQEVPDGTIVRWMFEYESGGVLGGLRNAVRLKGGTTQQMQAGLRNLHQLIVNESGGISTHEAKASVQEAPDAAERSSYQPRHPSSFQDSALDETDVSAEVPPTERMLAPQDLEVDLALFAALADTDTKPNPVIIGADGDENIDEPAEDEQEDTRPIDVDVLLAEQAPPMPGSTDIEPLPEPSLDSSAGQIAELTPDLTAEPDREPAPTFQIDSPREGINSASVSVFEIFGLTKPSELGERETDSAEPRREPSVSPVNADVRLGALPPGEREALRSSMVGNGDADFKDDARKTAGGSISGLRRNVRQRRRSLRSHH